jgi:hypothetical protein
MPGIQNLTLFCLVPALITVLLTAGCGSEAPVVQSGLNRIETKKPPAQDTVIGRQVSIQVSGYSEPVLGRFTKAGEFTIETVPSGGIVSFRKVWFPSPEGNEDENEGISSERLCQSIRDDVNRYSWNHEGRLYRKIRHSISAEFETSLAPFLDEAWLKSRIRLAQPSSAKISENQLKITNPLKVTGITSKMRYLPGSLLSTLGNAESVNPLSIDLLSSEQPLNWSLHTGEIRAMDALCDLLQQNASAQLEVSGLMGKDPFVTRVQLSGYAPPPSP